MAVDSISNNENHQPQPYNLAFPNWPWPQQGDASAGWVGQDLKPTKLIELSFWQLTATLNGTPLALVHDPVALWSQMPAPLPIGTALSPYWWHWISWLAGAPWVLEHVAASPLSQMPR